MNTTPNIDSATDHVNRIREHATGAAYDITNEAKDRLNQAQDKATDIYDAVRGYVKENPFTAFGVGIAAGLFISTYFRRR